MSTPRPTPSRRSSRASGRPCAGPSTRIAARGPSTARTRRTTGCCPRPSWRHATATTWRRWWRGPRRPASRSRCAAPGPASPATRSGRGWWWTCRGIWRASWRSTRTRGPRPCCRARSSTTSTGPLPPTACAWAPTRPPIAGARSAGCSATTPAGRARSGGAPRPRTRWGWRSSRRTVSRRRTGALGPALDAAHRRASSPSTATRSAASCPRGHAGSPATPWTGSCRSAAPTSPGRSSAARGPAPWSPRPRSASSGRRPCAACSSSPSPTTSPPPRSSRACCPSARSPSRA